MGIFGISDGTNVYNMNPYGNNPNLFQRPMVPNPPQIQPLNQPRELEKVNGIESAKQYPMQPNSMVALFDMNDDIFYLKVTDASNFPTIRKFRFVEEFDAPAQASQPTTEQKYVPYEEFAEFMNTYRQRMKEMEELKDGQQHIWEAIDSATKPADAKQRTKANDANVQDSK